MRVVVTNPGLHNATWVLESETLVIDVYDESSPDEITMTAQNYFDDLRKSGERSGLTNFDTAIPQSWADDVRKVTGKYPFGVVWDYSDGSIFGGPVALTREAYEILHSYNRIKDGIA